MVSIASGEKVARRTADGRAHRVAMLHRCPVDARHPFLHYPAPSPQHDLNKAAWRKYGMAMH